MLHQRKGKVYFIVDEINYSLTINLPISTQ